MFTTIINDCSDANAQGRLETRTGVLFGVGSGFVEVSGGLRASADLEASGSLVDVLDASRGEEGVVLVNVAPRSGTGKKWKNGTPFGYFWYKETLVVTSVDGEVLSLVKKLGIASEIFVVDIATVLEKFQDKLCLTKSDVTRITNTQFRSYEFLPFLARLAFDHEDIPSETMTFDEVEDAPKTVWWTDNFGNVKTTLLPEDVSFKVGKSMQTKFGELKCYDRLKDVPNGEAGIIVGSSGIEDKRFLELVVQGKSAKEKYGISVGDVVV